MGGAAPVLQSRSSSLPAVQQCSRLLLRRINQELALNLFVPHHAEGSILHALLPLVIIQEKAVKWEKKQRNGGGGNPEKWEKTSFLLLLPNLLSILQSSTKAKA